MAYVRVIADDSAASRAIRSGLPGERDLFSHIGFRRDDGTWLDCRYSMDPNQDGVRIRPADSVIDTRHLDFTCDGIEEMIANGEKLIGTRYDLSNIEGFIFNPNLHDPHKLICSRFVQQCSAGINSFFNPSVPFWEIRPGHYVLAYNRGYRELDRYPKDLVLTI